MDKDARVISVRTCEECIFCDDSILWCCFYRRGVRPDYERKPDWCKIARLIIEED